MDTQLLHYTLKELSTFTKQHKLEVIEYLIDCIADDKAYEVQSYYENEIEIKEK